jgi:hemoglobin
MSGSDTLTKPSPYEQLGGEEGVRRLTAAFYDAMETNPAFRELRDMHEPDLAPMREALAGFLAAWLGGPRDWITARGGFCIMSRHAKMKITPATASQWMAAMRQAIAQTTPPPELATQMDQALARLAEAMAWSGRD